AHAVVGEAPRGEHESRERERHEVETAAELEARHEVEKDEEKDAPEGERLEHALIDRASRPRGGGIVHPGVVVRALDDDREEHRLLGDVRIRQAAVQVPEAKARRRRDENGDERRLEEEEKQPSRISEELDHRYGTTTVSPVCRAKFCWRSPRSTTAL